MYRLIALDVDGTIVNSKGELPDPVRDAIRCAARSGIEVVLVSGRNWHGVRQILDQLGLDLWVISSGGAMVAHPHLGAVLEPLSLKRNSTKEIIRIARLAGAGISMELAEEHFWEGPSLYLSWIVNVIKIKINLVTDLLQLSNSDPLKMTIVQENEGLLRIEKELRRQQLDVNLTYSMPHYLEITRQGVNKGIALARLAQHLGVPLEQVAAIGDGENDISMFETAGLGIAMGNAPAKVRQAADLVAPTNDEYGLVWAIQSLGVIQ